VLNECKDEGKGREFIVLAAAKTIVVQKQYRTQENKPPNRIKSHHSSRLKLFAFYKVLSILSILNSIIFMKCVTLLTTALRLF